MCRFVLGITFIFSGFVKAVDPLGSFYKIQDYLEAFGLSAWVPWIVALFFGIGLAGIEFCVGVFLFLGIRRSMASWLALLLMCFMTPLTLYLALADPVSDCGCFGDAVVLTNWETFGKNVVLLAATVLLFMRPLAMPRFISRSNQWIVVNYTMLFILVSSSMSLYTLPPFDFRPYHIGANIRKGMEIPEGAKQPQFETTFILEKDGQRREFTLDDYPDSTWTFIDSKTVQTEAGYVPPIHDFSIQTTDGSEDITDSVLNHYMAQLRDVNYQGNRTLFRGNLKRIGYVMAYELSRTLRYSQKEVVTPLGRKTVSTPDDHIVIGTVLRAGLAFHEGFLDVFDGADSAFVAAYREEGPRDDLRIHLDYIATPQLDGSTFLLVDPMLATGSSLELAYQAFLAGGTPARLHLCVVIAAEEGVAHLARVFPSDDVTLWCAAIDPVLNEAAYIVPGLGDAGDLSFGPKKNLR